MNGLGLVYVYIDVYKDEIEIKEEVMEHLRKPDAFLGGELFQMRKALLRLEVVATQLEGDRAEIMQKECIEKLRAASHGKEKESDDEPMFYDVLN